MAFREAWIELVIAIEVLVTLLIKMRELSVFNGTISIHIY